MEQLPQKAKESGEQQQPMTQKRRNVTFKGEEIKDPKRRQDKRLLGGLLQSLSKKQE